MARPKKSAVNKKNSTVEAENAIQTNHTGNDAEMLEPSSKIENETSFNAEQKQRRHDENVALWRSLGFYEKHPNCMKHVKQQPVVSSKQRSQRGNLREKYKLCANASKKRLLLLQYPNREQDQIYSDETEQKPSEIRIKPKCGVVEVDIPLYTAQKFFDQEKGVDFGSALRKSQALQQGGAHGMAGGLGIGPIKVTKTKEETSSDGPPRERLLENFEDSSNKGYVMNKMTLSGRIMPFAEGDPIFMIATFDGATCTWTKLDAIVQLRPQFGHLDALSEQMRSNSRSDRYPQGQTTEPLAQDVNMVIKETADSENIDMYGGMNVTARLLRSMRDEPWQRLRWIDQADTTSYEVYDNTLIFQGPESTPHLISEMNNEQYLDAISCPRVDPIAQGKKVSQALGDTDESFDTEDEAVGADEAGDLAGADRNESDTSMGGRRYEFLPSVAIQPNGKVERDIEKLCRIICTASPNLTAKLESRFLETKSTPRYSFLDPSDPNHAFYRWRLEQNIAGHGIDPQYDRGLGQGQGNE